MGATRTASESTPFGFSNSVPRVVCPPRPSEGSEDSAPSPHSINLPILGKIILPVRRLVKRVCHRLRPFPRWSSISFLVVLVPILGKL